MTQPALPLQKYIYSYWEFFTEQPLTQPYHHRVVADGCIAIIIDMLNRKTISSAILLPAIPNTCLKVRFITV
jgi:hypothetical protein